MHLPVQLVTLESYLLFEFQRNDAVVKGLVSSLTRSLFCGVISIVRRGETPLFKVERKTVIDILMPVVDSNNVDERLKQKSRDFLFEICDLVQPKARQWVVVAHSGSLALRNIDHLIPANPSGPFSPPEVDFYWARAGRDDISNQSATPGLWAVRGEYLPLVLERLREEWSRELEPKMIDQEAIWTRVVQQLPLRKRAFEKGEVVAPRIGAVDWEAVSNAAFVTVPDWPEKEAWKFLQALYFGTFLGDETGMMLNILEA